MVLFVRLLPRVAQWLQETRLLCRCRCGGGCRRSLRAARASASCATCLPAPAEESPPAGGTTPHAPDSAANQIVLQQLSAAAEEVGGPSSHMHHVDGATGEDAPENRRASRDAGGGHGKQPGRSYSPCTLSLAGSQRTSLPGSLAESDGVIPWLSVGYTIGVLPR